MTASTLLFRIGVLAAVPALAAENVVVQWNAAALQAIREARFGPTMAARALAVTQTCAFDAWAAYDPVAVGTRLGGDLRRPRAEHTQQNKKQAISFAAYRALVDLFPTEAAAFDSLMSSLGYDPSDTSTDVTTPSGIGNVAAAAVLDFRHHDGSNQLGDLHPGAYSDYTGYVPVNGPDTIVDPNRWQQLRFANGMAPGFLTPFWGQVVPFALSSGAQFRAEPPALYPSLKYIEQADELIQISAALMDTQKVITEYWVDGPGTVTPPGHWNVFGQFVSQRDGHTLDQDVVMFFALSNAVMDAGIAAWETKRFYDYVRPITAIRFLYDGKEIRAWGGPYQGTQMIDGGDWLPYQEPNFITPPFAEYVSGHSAFSASAATVLRLFTGSDAFNYSTTIPAGSSPIEPGATPASRVTLAWPTFSEAAEAAGMSRRYGGIHFRDGDLNGRAMGRKVGQVVWRKALTYLHGCAPGVARER